MGLRNLRVRYRLSVDFDDYRRCGNHPDSDLARLPKEALEPVPSMSPERE